MFYVETSGSYYEMGVQFGRATALQIASMLDYLTKRFRTWDDAKFNRARERHMRYTEKRCPELVEEITGIADGSGFPFRSIYLMNFYAVMRAGNDGCSNIIFPRTPTGPLLAKTNDLPVHEGHHSGVRLSRPKSGPAILASTMPGTVWLQPAMNEWGLAMGGSSCSAEVPVPSEYLAPHVVVQYALTRASTVAESVAILAELSIPRWGANIALVDRSGTAAIVEKAGSVQGVRMSQGEPIFCTNFSCTSELSAYRLDNPPVLKESTDRFHTIETLLRDRQPSAKLMRQILSTTEQPGAVSRYGHNDPLKYETELAMIFHPASGEAEFCFSHPDRDPWRTFSMSKG